MKESLWPYSFPCERSIEEDFTGMYLFLNFARGEKTHCGVNHLADEQGTISAICIETCLLEFFLTIQTASHEWGCLHGEQSSKESRGETVLVQGLWNSLPLLEDAKQVEDSRIQFWITKYFN
ncbi:hypothetical protein WN943_015909 [Citrus x changshan-huyou]